MTAEIPWTSSGLKRLTHATVIYQYSSQALDLGHMLKKLIFHSYAAILTCILMNREARGGAAGSGTAFQTGRSLVRFPLVSLYWPNPSSLTTAPGSTQSLTEMNTGNISWEGEGYAGLTNYNFHVLIVMKCGSFNLLETSRPAQVLLYFYFISVTHRSG